MINEKEYNRLRKKILKLFAPSEEYVRKVEKKVRDFVNLLKSIDDRNYIVSGSFSRYTFLKKIEDIDIFVEFDSEEEMKKLKEIVKKIGNYKSIKGTREYYRVKYKGLTFELVPVLNIRRPEKAKNTIDISKFHVEYLKEKIDKKLREEIIILKAFLKGINLYGAESYKEAISGYASELLILYFGNFLNFIYFFSNAKPIVFIDIERYYNNINEAIKALGESKVGPLIVIDPVLKTRNVTASLSYDNFYKLVFFSKLFIARPSLYFFNNSFEKKLVKLFNKKYGKVIEVSFKKFNKYQKEILLSKIKKVERFGRNLLEKEGYRVIISKIFENQWKIKFLIEDSKFVKFQGPPIYVSQKNFNEFIKGKEFFWVEGDKVVYMKKKKSLAELKKEIIEYMEKCFK